MEPIAVGVSAFMALSAFIFGAGFILVRQKYTGEVKASRQREEEFKRKMYEAEVLKEIGDRIGYSLDAAKIVEIISGSLGKLLPHSTICHMLFDEKEDKVNFSCSVNEPVSPLFIKDVREKMIISSKEIMQKAIVESEISESIAGAVLDEKLQGFVKSYFNLPIVISGKLVGMINVSSTQADLYDHTNTEFLFTIAKNAASAVSKLQEVLENEKSKLLQAVDSLSEGVIMVDTKYKLVLVNRKLKQLLALMENPALFDIVNALSGNLDLRSLVDEAIAHDDDLPPREIEVRDKVLQVLASKVIDKKRQKALGVVVLFHDITDAKSLEKLRNDFTSMMVHELRAPLTSIKSTVELLQEGIYKKSVADAGKELSSVQSTAQTMLEVVNDLLDVAKMEAGKFDVISEAGDLEDAISDRAEAFKSLAAAKNLKITPEIEENLPKAYFDKVRIKQVLNNLLSNAVKFSNSGEIKIKAVRQQDENAPMDIVVSVSDSGIGIEPDEGDKLFSRFGQLVRGSRSLAAKGSGLGLYIAKGIVEAMGGSIWYESEGAGYGSTFYFTVPAAVSVPDYRAAASDRVVINKIARA
ncbi:MAG TPA: GAF domain-containing sensor histidine kinase [Patescibacteria group bacterium]|nr:GAF domain-containing sensor histidine kinase [Patescibacteria group bacterium]